ncbi:MAG: DUF1028 domain-containing protein [Bacteroidota bacterium]
MERALDGPSPLHPVRDGFAFSAVIISDVLPGRGAIHTQSFLNAANKALARSRMLLGESPNQIINYMIVNDAQGDSTIRQYGVVDFDANGSPRAAAFTGSNCFDVKTHRIGPNYAIQGNILLNAAIVDSMEARFLTTSGTLAEKLMAAMQGANVPGADSRCLSEGVSSLSAFLRVARPNDAYGFPYLDLVVASTPFGVEPIDSLQSAFDGWSPPECNFAIPTDAVVISQDTSLAVASLSDYWVCEGDSLRIEGGFFNTVFLENNAYLRLQSINSTVYMKDGSILDASGTGDVEVFYQPNSVIVDYGPEPSPTACDSVLFDYTDAPDDGCLALTALEVEPQRLFSLFPNPSQGDSFIRLTQPQSRDLSCQLFNAAGQLVWEEVLRAGEQEKRIQIDGLSEGVYLLHIHNEQRFQVEKLIRSAY